MAIAIGIIAFAIVLGICITHKNELTIQGIIFFPTISAYVALSEIYCIFSDTYITDIFVELATISFRAPGIIFDFSPDGLIALIVTKIFLFVISIVFAILMFIFALFISAICSFVSFPIIVFIKNNKEEKKNGI